VTPMMVSRGASSMVDSSEGAKGAFIDRGGVTKGAALYRAVGTRGLDNALRPG